MGRKTTVFFSMPLLSEAMLESGTDVLYGGAEVQMSLLIAQLRQNPDIRIILLDDRLPEIPGIECRSLSLVKHGVPGVSRLINARRKREYFAREDDGPGILLLTLAPSHKLMEMARECGIKTVFRINGDSILEDSVINKQPAVRAIQEMFAQFDLVVVQSEYQQELLESRFGIVAAPIVRNSVRDSGPGTPPMREYVLWVGRPAPLKRPWLFVQLARRFPAEQFLMVMPSSTNEALFEVIEAKSQKLSNLTLIAGLPHSEMPDVYRHAKAFVSTSMTEGVPSVFAEAAITGTPIVSLSVNPSSILSSGDIGFCAHDDFDRLSNKLEELLSDDGLRLRMSQAAREFALKEWDGFASLCSYMDAFETVLRFEQRAVNVDRRTWLINNRFARTFLRPPFRVARSIVAAARSIGVAVAGFMTRTVIRARSLVGNVGKVHMVLPSKNGRLKSLFLPVGYLYRRCPVYCAPGNIPGASVAGQPEVYAAVDRAAATIGSSTVIDLGCGKGRMVARLADHYEIFGVDYGPNIEFCRSNYGVGTWVESDFEHCNTFALPERVVKGSVVVCADVIEHLIDPIGLIRLIRDMLDTASIAIISTPDRILTRGVDHKGPPQNKMHVREWAIEEFRCLLESQGLHVDFADHTRASTNDSSETVIFCLCTSASLSQGQRSSVEAVCREVIHSWNSARPDEMQQERSAVIPNIIRDLVSSDSC